MVQKPRHLVIELTEEVTKDLCGVSLFEEQKVKARAMQIINTR